MQTVLHQQGDQRIIELISDEVLIKTAQDALDLLYNLPDPEDRKIILHKENISPAFFDLKTGIAGDILQKFVNYKIQFAVVGDFQNIKSDSLRAFLIESNRGRHAFFVEDLESAKQKLFAV
ncbi:DUF4180 domain-containing protein [Bdellovibrio sp. HCB337]|uniref:DUF4180 domain-containing protein n=1 Tax=Bdellovibrio sp. HCB337 TaxID=3394358 RepID=UPI0039A67F10